ncbi:MAG: GntR family transcriptional regulator [Candidatus Neomarinimicrobiota bacterium]
MTISFDNETPIYLQVAQIIRDAVVAGDLPEGQAIPSVRHLSVEQGLNPQTVLNATRLLLDEGILEKRRGVGVFVHEGARKTLLAAELKQFKGNDLPAMVKRAQLLGLSRSATLDLVKARFKE